VLGALAAFAPWQLGVKADPFAPAPAGIKPEWYFLFMFQALKLLPAKILSFDGDMVGVVLFGIVALGWLLLPFATAEGRPRRIQVVTGIGAFAATYMAAMTIYAYISK
jgi:quinol-cytochrome oxidoreductase complex cytochrome b subunit